MKKYILKIKNWIFLRLLFNGLYIIAIAAIPYIIKFALDYDYSLNGYMTVFKFIAFYLFIVLTGTIFQYFSQMAGWKVYQKFYLLIRDDLFSSIIRRKNVDFKRKSIAEYVSILNNDVPLLQEYIGSWIMAIESVTQIIIYGIYLIALDYRVALVIIFTSVLSLFLPNLTGKKLSHKRESSQKTVGQYMQKTTDLLSGFYDINRESQKNFIREQRISLNTMENTRLLYGKFKTISIILNGICMYLLDIAAFSAVVFSLLFKTITTGTAAALLSYIKEFTYPIRSLMDGISAIKSTKGVQTKIFSLLDYTSKAAAPVTRFETSIDFNHIEKQWDGFKLQDFSYSFRRGKKYAIIGHSGSGKSTLFQLIAQRVIPDSGTITIDRQNIEDIDYTPVLSYITQKEYIYQAGFEDNVTVFHTYMKKPIQEVISFMDNTQMHMLQRKSDCTDLSGGEKNLLAIIKLLLMDKEVILLDEPFSALDIQNKKTLQNKLFSIPDKTMLVITHDISRDCLQYFDEVLLLQNGRLILSGDAEAVINSNEYKQLLLH